MDTFDDYYDGPRSSKELNDGDFWENFYEEHGNDLWDAFDDDAEAMDGIYGDFD